MTVKNSNRTFVFAFAIAISLSMLTATTSTRQTVIAQNPTHGQSSGTAPLNFYVKLNNNQSTSEAAAQAASNGTGTKNITITVNVQKGPSGNVIKLPISAIVPNNINPQDLQLCASLSSGQQMCQPLGQNTANIDLSSSANSTAKTTPQSYQHDNANILDVLFNPVVQYANAQLISVNNTTLNIPITVIVPITIEIQNAQICASVASSGSQTCQQIVLNPTQTAYTPVNVDLSNPATPTVTTQPTATTGNNATPSAPSSTQQTPAGNVSGSPSSNSSSELPNASPNQPSPSSNPPSTTSDNPSTGEPSNNNAPSSSDGSSTSGSDTGTTSGDTPSDSGTGGSSPSSP